MKGALDSLRAWASHALSHAGRRIAPGSAGCTKSEREALMQEIALLERRCADLERANTAATAANQAKSRFLASASHEIRSPLNSIYGYAQLLERNEGRNALQAARIIRRSSEHLASLVEGLLDLSHVESGALRLQREVIRFPALLEQVVDMFEPQAEAKGLHFRLECPPKLPEFVRGDQKRLRQVLINLVSNAIKFTDSGQVTLKVAYRNDLAIFEIADTGIGIGPDDIDHIFDPFHSRSDELAKRPGVGLGLSITQALVQVMGGEIRVESRLGEGSRFTVRLMLSQPQSHPADTTPTTVITGYSGRRRTILVVDDDEAQRSLLASLLEPLGFTVLTAGDADSAVAIAGESGPDLVLLDITMPGRTGWDVADALRQAHGTTIRIVMLSANAHEHHPGGDGDMPNDMFLLKPFEFSNLLDVISAQLWIEWTGSGSSAAGRAAEGVPDVRPPLPAATRPHFAEIERLVRTGHVRGIESQIDAIAASHPAALPVAQEMRACLDAFDLKALAAIARTSQNDAV
ncbi:hybrid sensor histidine kinase/response regulator [Croceicoccus marinus]|uniref:histidine kinase n=1 Tax=Croceicoccus marinus TaxID=450378 RepID=A0A1Z1FBU3_9SPHN|nr:hybrid sensor histidine kinase/response regulator [Croceicoccus marinus]ARU16203.1 hybrid sensor histidine kinase/response regulator [Croceicoccus marinus]